MVTQTERCYKHRKIIDKLFVFSCTPKAPPIPDLIENQFDFYWLQNILVHANESVVPIIEKTSLILLCAFCEYKFAGKSLHLGFRNLS